MKWISANTPPEETGRYWCYVEAISCLGKESYQWNCAYNAGENRWSERDFVGVVVAWMPLPDPPKF